MLDGCRGLDVENQTLRRVVLQPHMARDCEPVCAQGSIWNFYRQEIINGVIFLCIFFSLSMICKRMEPDREVTTYSVGLHDTLFRHRMGEVLLQPVP